MKQVSRADIIREFLEELVDDPMRTNEFTAKYIRRKTELSDGTLIAQALKGMDCVERTDWKEPNTGLMYTVKEDAL